MRRLASNAQAALFYCKDSSMYWIVTAEWVTIRVNRRLAPSMDRDNKPNEGSGFTAINALSFFVSRYDAPTYTIPGLETL